MWFLVRRKSAPRRKLSVGGRVLLPTGGPRASAGVPVPAGVLSGWKQELQSVANRMPRSGFGRGGRFAFAVLSGLQRKDGGRRSLFAVSSCRNRETREEVSAVKRLSVFGKAFSCGW